MAALGASEIDQLGRRVISENKRQESPTQASSPATPVAYGSTTAEYPSARSICSGPAGQPEGPATIAFAEAGGKRLPHRDLPPELGELPSEPWPTIDKAAYCGLVGHIVQTLLPHTEADPVALMIQTLTTAGNVIGRLPHYPVEADQHRTNLFAVLVGDSAKGRKGVSFGRVRSVVEIADEPWAKDRIKNGLSSGEGFIYAVRDPVEKYEFEGEAH